MCVTYQYVNHHSTDLSIVRSATITTRKPLRKKNVSTEKRPWRMNMLKGDLSHCKGIYRGEGKC